MMALTARILVIVSLLFGSVVLPAMAEAKPGHEMELVDIDCYFAERGGSDQKMPDSEPAGHMDHHHCAAYVALNGFAKTSPAFLPSKLFFLGRETAPASYATAPPTQPPSA